MILLPTDLIRLIFPQRSVSRRCSMTPWSKASSSTVGDSPALLWTAVQSVLRKSDFRVSASEITNTCLEFTLSSRMPRLVEVEAKNAARINSKYV